METMRILTCDGRTICIFALSVTQDEMEHIARDYALAHEGDYEEFAYGKLVGVCHALHGRDGYKVEYRIEEVPLKF